MAESNYPAKKVSMKYTPKFLGSGSYAKQGECVFQLKNQCVRVARSHNQLANRYGVPRITRVPAGSFVL